MMLSNRFQTIGNQLFLHLQMRAKRALFMSFWLLLLKLWLLSENLAILATFCNGGNFGYFVNKRCSLRSHCQNLGKIQTLFLVKLGQFSVITKKIVLWHLILWWKPISHLLKRKKSWKQLLFFLLFHVSRISDDQTRGKGGKPWSHLISDQRDEISFLLLRFFLYKSVSISGTMLWYLHDQKCSHHNSWNNFILSSRGASRKFRASSLFGKAKTRSKGKSHF